MKKGSQVKNVAKLSQVQLIDEIIVRMENKKLSEESVKEAKPFMTEFAKRNNLSENAAMLFAAFFNDFADTHIWIRDIAQFFECNKVKILTKWAAIEELVNRRFILQYKKDNGDLYFSVPNAVVAAMREDTIYSPNTNADLTIDQWFSTLSKLLNDKDHDNIPFVNFVDDLQLLINSNQHLVIARELATITDEEDLVIFAGIMDLFVRNNDNHVIREDIEDLLESRWQMRSHAKSLEKGVHPLQVAGLIEQTDCNGQVEADAWKLTDAAKERFLAEVDCSTPAIDDKNIRKADSITEKPLFFNAAVSKQMAQLESLLQEDRFAAVQENLVKHGMRRGFACIFYGAPGTGKTESVLQLARKTGRGIMIVDVPNLRDKYVGETEKNTKAIFDKYRKLCKNAKLAPILLFNEADAVLCKRNEGATGSVDKMENAMQNIILQEMENLEGIMIATTNLTGNLDAAFERRFLYKIEFPKPTPNESQHIWHAMLPEISEPEAFELAKQYAFSGGQIENIARKQLVNAVLTGEDKVSMEAIKDACKSELFNTSSTKRIGFC
jgi:AAA+ superfamily predicted ATPase